MVKTSPRFYGLLFPTMVFLGLFLCVTEGSDIGICYGLNGDNLPSPADVINLYKSSKVLNVRLYQPYPEVLEALQGSGIFVAMGSRNEDIPNFAADQSAANDWVNTNIVPYKDDVDFKWIIIGNEVIPGQLGASVPGASYPPSSGAYTDDSVPIMTGVATILSQLNAPLMANVYPYFAYAHVSAEFALFESTSPVVIDQGLDYYNLFDAMVDAHNSALEKINFGGVSMAIAET
ncbi:Glycosyl hydrolase superfamily protein, putative isoform 2 [Hibiscus syriacus]|uniref:glucan endo-1,3-beta-D-glucosidase n=1 Tax=Hibiscus syriacus TaxID=106335 RepID=A0A6A2X3S6_HIBSY|nr:Glycosyl hydrolase superfamily protein, putative isoform 2 [Hibiscus syriacus]